MAQALLHPPGQVGRVDREAVAAHPGPGREAHVPEGLGGGGVDGLPHVDTELAGEHGDLIDQGDVDVAEGVLEQLGDLRHPRARDGDGALDQSVVEALDLGQAGGRDAGDHLGRVLEAPVRIAGVDPLGAVAQVERTARHQARALLEDRSRQLFGGAGIGGGLEDDGGAFGHGGGNYPASVLDEGEVGDAFVQRRWDTDDGEVETGQVGGIMGRHVPARGDRRLEPVVGDVLDGRRAAVDGVDLLLHDVVPDDAPARLDGPHRHRQPDVPLPDHSDRSALLHEPMLTGSVDAGRRGRPTNVRRC